jgi:hypothetical protein
VFTNDAISHHDVAALELRLQSTGEPCRYQPPRPMAGNERFGGAGGCCLSMSADGHGNAAAS